jgi:hypothetical protein
MSEDEMNRSEDDLLRIVEDPFIKGSLLEGLD